VAAALTLFAAIALLFVVCDPVRHSNVFVF